MVLAAKYINVSRVTAARPLIDVKDRSRMGRTISKGAVA
jgi:hypothetical protein